MAYDAHSTLCAALLTNSPGAGGTSFIVTTGTGALFPATPFNATVWTANTLPVRAASQLGIPNSALAEVVRVTGITGDTLTVTRAQENTTAQAWAAGVVIGNTITALDITAIEAQALGGTVTETGAATTNHLAVFADNTGLVIKDGGVPATGTVTSVSLTGDGTIVQTGPTAPVTGSGTLTVALNTQTANRVLAGPTSGAAAAPTFRALTSADIPSGPVNKVATFVCDGSGAVLTSGLKGFLYIPWACTITKATILADQSGTVAVDIWKAAYASFPPTIANTIVNGHPVTLTSQQNNQDTSIIGEGWTTSVSAGDVFAFNLNVSPTITSVTRIILELELTMS